MDRPPEAATRPSVSARDGATAAPPAASPPVEPVQRWRLTFAREAVPSELVGRAGIEAWDAALTASGLPVAGLEPGGAGHARFVLGAPLPASASGRAELADVWLLERRPAWAVREALEGAMPAAHRYLRAEDVWLGMAPLPGQIVGAVWSVALATPAPGRDALGAACRQLLEAEALPRVRARASGDRSYDLRPLLVDLGLGEPAEPGGDRTWLRMTTRFDPALGSGRPEEVLAAIGDVVGTPLTAAAIIRDELVLADPRRDPTPAKPQRTVRKPPRR